MARKPQACRRLSPPRRRPMENRNYVGLDLSKTSTMATAVDPLGHIIRQEKLGVSDEELLRFLGEIPGPKQVVMEACNVWEHNYDAAVSTGADVLLANPFKITLVSKATLKTDRVDSEKLALLARLNAIPESYAPSPQRRALRRLVRERVFYRAKWKAGASHTYALLLRKGIPYRSEILTRPTLRGALRAHGVPEVDRGLDALVKIEAISKPLDRASHIALPRVEGGPAARLHPRSGRVHLDDSGRLPLSNRAVLQPRCRREVLWPLPLGPTVRREV